MWAFYLTLRVVPRPVARKLLCLNMLPLATELLATLCAVLRSKRGSCLVTERR